jgi:DNA-binding transcriptional regulator YiaG
MTGTAQDSLQLDPLEALLGEAAARRTLPGPAERRRLREGADLSLGQIACVLGVTRQAVARWEQGSATPRGNLAVRYRDLLERLREVGR